MPLGFILRNQRLKNSSSIHQVGFWSLHYSRVHCFRVHCFRMKNITLSADESLIEKARSVARAQRRSLNDAFREWLQQFAMSDGEAAAVKFDELMKQLKYVKIDQHFTRDELNER